MTQYKPKVRYYFINSNKQPQYVIKADYVILNLNSVFTKIDSYGRFEYIINEIKDYTNRINLCNLASLCYKFEIPYASKDTLNFVDNLISICAKNNINIIQQNILNFGEYDMKPISNLIYWDRNRDIIFCNNILMETLKKLGYADNQLFDILDFCIDFGKIIPKDLIEQLPITNKATTGCYNMILERLGEKVL